MPDIKKIKKINIKYIDQDPYYDQLPSIFRIATLDDFYLEDHLILNKPYLIHSEVNPNCYWAKRTKEDFMNHNDFYLFINKKRIYVLR